MLEPEVIKAEQEWAQEVVTNARSILIRNNKVATGRLVNSIRYTVNPQGEIVFLYSEDGKWVSQGRKRHPGRGVNPKGKFVASLKDWIRAKGIQGRGKDGRFITNQSLAYLIARGINREGIKPLPFMKMAVKESIKKLAPKLARVKARAVVQRLKREISKP
jgi:hypothetical protein